MSINSCLPYLKLIRRGFFIALCLLSTSFKGAYGQGHSATDTDPFTDLTNILPPSPEAFQMTKYGGLHPGLSTGTSQAHVPLFQIKNPKLSFSVDLNYSTNGLKVDEISSRAGMGWVLNGSGVISRTVMGTPDVAGHTVFVALPENLENYINDRPTFEKIKLGAMSASNSPYDTQPDIYQYSFSGYSGKFYIDPQTDSLILIANAPIKIQKDLSVSATAWNFIATTPDGVKYYFGGNAATEQTYSSTSGTYCGKIFDYPVPTAWYLTKIKYPLADSITFSYKPISFDYQASVNESITKTPQSTSSTGCSLVVTGSTPKTCPIVDKTSLCYNQLNTQTYFLSAIDSKYVTYKFNYNNGVGTLDSLLNNICLYSKSDGHLFKKINLLQQDVVSTQYLSTYSQTHTGVNHRPFLMGLEEVDPLSGKKQVYKFSYNNLDKMPSRLSYSRDTYGYFNGKTNNHLIPQPEADYQYINLFPTNLANKTPDFNYSKVGTLSKIQYPTGGYDSIEYEANVIYGRVLDQPQKDNTLILGTVGVGAKSPQSVTSAPFYASGSLMVKNICTGLAGDGTYDLHCISEFQILDQTAGGIVLSGTTKANTTHTYPMVNFLLNHQYVLTVTAYGSVVSGEVDVFLPPTPATYKMGLYEAPGLRVKRVITSSGSAPDMVKTYNYTKLNDTMPSGEVVGFEPKYFYDSQTLLNCSFSTDGSNGLPPQSYADLNGTPCIYQVAQSNSLRNLYSTEGSYLYYSAVTEDDGDVVNHGVTEHIFSVNQDVPSRVVFGKEIANAPLSNNGINNGAELQTTVYKLKSSSYIPVEQTINNYKLDNRYFKQRTVYVIRQEFTGLGGSNNPGVVQPYETAPYDIAMYKLTSYWTYPDTVTKTTYDLNGLNPIKSTVINTYNNPGNPQVSQNTLINSKGDNIINTFKYATDLTSITGLRPGAVTAAQYLLNTNQLGAVLQREQFKNSIPVFKGRTDYKIANGFALPDTTFFQNGNQALEPRVANVNYNTSGDIVSQTLVGGAYNSYQWDSNRLPIAQVKNASSSEFYYEGFEESAATGTTTGVAHTGKKYTTNATISWTRPNSRIYVISYWYRSSGIWQYQSEQVYTAASFTMTGGDAYDDIRIYPKDAQMTTYTYDPLVGITSSTDAKSETTTYEYDSFQRLMNVKDKDGNIIKHMDYHFQGQ